MDLFDRVKSPQPEAQTATSTSHLAAPLADRMRPASLDELEGHAAQLGTGTPLREAILADRAPSMLLWGPPGCGKTTLARVVAASSRAAFVPLSAVLSGVADIRAAVTRAESERRAGRATLVFVDEIHRFNKAQQDALLPHIESGAVRFIGATTENPSFSVVSALLSRCQVVRLEALSRGALASLLERALADVSRGLGAWELTATPEAVEAIADWADGDARRALGLLEQAAGAVRARGGTQLDLDAVRSVAGARTLRHDRAGDAHYDLASAFIKSLRGSDPDAALYWCLRLLEAGDDPLFVLRRMMIFAAEDIGLADPRALEIAVSADQAFQRLGLPEGLIPIASTVTYLACAPKSKSAYLALRAAQEAVRAHGSLPVPLHLRNAPTEAMKSWGFGSGYQDPQQTERGWIDAQYLPDALAEARFWNPTRRGLEARITDHLRRLRTTAPPRADGEPESGE